MKKRLKNIVRSLIKHLLLNNLSWKLAGPVFKKTPYLFFLRKQIVKDQNKLTIDHYFNDLIVKNGVFKGLRYPKLESSGSAIYPKLLGSYEAELHEIIEEILSKPLDMLIDIGCAEGYYLTGFGMKVEKIKLIGVDISEIALHQTEKMLMENNINLDSVSLYQNFDPSIILKNGTKNTLIICDCEGYEKNIFTTDSSSVFSNCSLLIECHDFIVPNITKHLTNILSQTHQLTLIKSMEDENLKLNFIPSELQEINLEDKINLIKEGRPCIMNWIYAKPIQ